MVKILKAGTKKRIECGSCGALLEYENSDVKSEYMGDSGYYQSYTKDYIICPQCQHEVECNKDRR